MLDLLRLPKHVTETVGRDDEEDALGRAASGLCFDIRLGGFLGFDFLESSLDVIHLEITSFLRWVTAIFCQRDLNIVTRQNSAAMRRIFSLRYAKSQCLFVKRNCGVDITDGQVHGIARIWNRALEFGFHY